MKNGLKFCEKCGEEWDADGSDEGAAICNVCSVLEHRTCWCPCGCGCTEPKEEISPSGLCPDCEEGNHEVPPEGIKHGVEELIQLYESIVAQFKRVLQDRNKTK